MIDATEARHLTGAAKPSRRHRACGIERLRDLPMYASGYQRPTPVAELDALIRRAARVGCSSCTHTTLGASPPTPSNLAEALGRAERDADRLHAQGFRVELGMPRADRGGVAAVTLSVGW